jgi:activator of HSP90 ATPase
MAPFIEQHVRFATPPQNLYEMYVDSKKHSQSTGAPAKILAKAGGKFTAFGGQLEGKTLFLARGKQIVQVWRASHWKKEDWSILILDFRKVAGGAQLHLAHIGVPEYDQQGVREGWPKYYWRPWKKYLSRQK